MRAVHAHERAAAHFERLGEPACAAMERDRAAAARIAYAQMAAQHPEWSPEVSVGLARGLTPRRHDALIADQRPRR